MPAPEQSLDGENVAIAGRGAYAAGSFFMPNL